MDISDNSSTYTSALSSPVEDDLPSIPQFAPRPLAIKPTYIKRTRTNRAGLRQTPYAKRYPSLDLGRYRSTAPLESMASHANLPLSSKHGRRLHGDIVDDQKFLIEIRALWMAKLEQLKTEHDILTCMARCTEEEVQDLESLPLTQQTATMPEETMPVLPSEEEQPLASVSRSSPTASTLLTTPKPSSPSRQEEIETTLEDALNENPAFMSQSTGEDYLDDIYAGGQFGNTDDDEYESAEDDEEARRALSYMLEQYGDKL
ncbi:hypothetical protein EC973_002128 [Apophysomyces ossiformis]|uniref:Uncharacterized protein n=1 Tax=Apophysomyces ossiformis TaxID=679940 RepID=A0A8H7ERE4_9FUNG|nr:hypothetical protein EC973_002128 [Apophysomyces ossiformis]